MQKKVCKQILIVATFFLVANFTFAQSLGFDYGGFFKNYKSRWGILEPINNLFCTFSGSCGSRQTQTEQEGEVGIDKYSGNSSNSFLHDRTTLDQYVEKFEEQKAEDDTEYVNEDEEEVVDENNNASSTVSTKKDGIASLLDSLKPKETLDTSIPNFYADPTDPNFTPPTKAQIENRFYQTGKDYVPPSSPDYISEQSYRNANYGTPKQAEDFYKSNPNLIGAPTNNQSVWNGDPQSRPKDLTNSNQVRVDMNDPNFSGQPDANIDALRSLQDGRFNLISKDGWLGTRATNFGLNINGSADTGLVSYKLGCPTAMGGFSVSGSVKVCNKAACVVSFPPDVLDYYFGKTKWPYRSWRLDGNVPYTYGSAGKLYRKVAGTPVEVVNTDNGRCTVVPLWEVGPSKRECQRGKCGMDLTYCVKVVLLDSKKGLTPVKYRPVPAGKRGCEGYNYIEAPVHTFPSKKKNS